MNSKERESVIIVGNKGATNVGESLQRAAISLGREIEFCEAGKAYSKLPLLQSVMWHFADHRPMHLKAFGRSVEAVAKHPSIGVLISTGLTPLTAATLERLRAQGIKCFNYSTDDPWNPGQQANWFSQSLPVYDQVFTTRRSNIDDLRKIGAKVSYLPFGYDSELFFVERSEANEPVSEAHEPVPFDVLFVGGADDDRVKMIGEILNSGLRVGLYGNYWDRYRSVRKHAFGRADVPLLRNLTSRVAINLCLCRRANRDGHVMRSYEIPAIGGFMLAEDTQEHRDMFGQEGECVLYFGHGRDAVEKGKWALQHPTERRRMAASAHERIVRGCNTYGHRLQSMLLHAES